MRKMKIKLLAISASPRNGNTQYLLNKALEHVNEFPVEVDKRIYSFKGKSIKPCTGCLACYKNSGNCILKDDFEELRQIWIESDAIVYASPVYVAGIPGELKCFFDRLHNSFYGYYDLPSMRHLKSIGYITQGGCIYGGQELAMQAIINHAILINSLPVAPDGSYIGVGGWSRGDDKDAFKRLTLQGDEDAIMTINVAQNMVKRVIEIAAILKAGSASLKGILSEDPRYLPYLSRIKQDF